MWGFIVTGVILALALATLLISYITYRIAFSGKRVIYDPLYGLDRGFFEKHGATCRGMIESLLAVEYESVYITSRDGLTLAGRYYKGKKGAPLEIQCHGYKGHPCRDFSGGATESLKSGRHLLLIYQRAHGESEGKTISFGVKESLDLLEWIEWGRRQLGEDIPICLTGISMGGATVIITAGRGVPDNVKCVIADCPCSSTKDIIMKVARERGYPEKIAYPFLRLGAKIFGGFDPEEITARDAVRSAKVPVLLIHGEADTFVPLEMSEEIRDAAPELCRLVTFPAADHGMSYLEDRERYMTEVSTFLDRHLYGKE